MASKGFSGAALPSGDSQPKSKSKTRPSHAVDGAGASLPSGDPQPKSKSNTRPSHAGAGAGASLPSGDPQSKSKSKTGASGDKKKVTPKHSQPSPGDRPVDAGKLASNPNPNSEPRKPSSSVNPSKSPSMPTAAPNLQTVRQSRKRKAGDGEPPLASSPSKPLNGGTPSGSSKGRPSDAKIIYQKDCITILRAAIDFRKRTGAAPTQKQVYQSVEGSLHVDLSEKQVRNRLRTLRSNFKNAPAIGRDDDPVYKLARELWSSEEEDAEEGKKVKKAKKGEKENLPSANGGSSSAVAIVMEDAEKEAPAREDAQPEEVKEKTNLEADKRVAKQQVSPGLQAYPFVALAVHGNWKIHGGPDALLVEDLNVDPAKAKALEDLEDEWSKFIRDDVKIEKVSAKVNGEILELIQ